MGNVFEIEIQARVRDVNLGGHVDNVEAIRVLDEARILFFGIRHAHAADAAVPGVGTTHRGLLLDVPPTIADLVGAQRVDYRAEMRFVPFQPFLVRMWVGHVGRSSLTVESELRVAPDRPPAIVAETTSVLWDTGAGRAWPIPDELRTRFEEFRAAPVDLKPRPLS